MDIWLVLLLGLLVSLGYRYFTAKIFGDVEMMQMGGLIYVAVPFVTYSSDVFDDYGGVSLWKGLFSAAFNESIPILALCIALAICYNLGRKIQAPTLKSLNRPIHERTARLIAIALWAFWGSLIISHREVLGAGYSVEYDPELLGQLGTINLVCTILTLNARQFSTSTKPTARNFAVLGLLVANSLALLSMGGRMYVFASIIALLLQFLSSTRQRVGPLVVVGLVVASMLFVGLWRIGSDLDLGFFVYIAAGEPLFTSMSLGSFISHNGIPALAAPYQFLGSVVNFIPSAIFPNKIQFIPSIQDAGLYFESPLGATNILVSLLGNFGWLGSLFFAGLFGWFMGGLRRGAREGWWLYFYVCSLLPFMFFRDGFSIFNKAVVFNGMILPYIFLKLDSFSMPARGTQVANVSHGR